MNRASLSAKDAQKLLPLTGLWGPEEGFEGRGRTPTQIFHFKLFSAIWSFNDKCDIFTIMKPLHSFKFYMLENNLV